MADDQQFCLRWNDHQSTLIQNFDMLLESGVLADCTLAAEGKYLKAHKLVLSACSPYFEGLLSENYDKHAVFILKDVKFKELKAIMDYMYRGEVNISEDQLTALLKVAESLKIKGLSNNKVDNNVHESDGKETKSNAPSLMVTSDSQSSPSTFKKRKTTEYKDCGEDFSNFITTGSEISVSRKKKKLRRGSFNNETCSEQDVLSSDNIDVFKDEIHSGTRNESQKLKKTVQKSSVHETIQNEKNIFNENEIICPKLETIDIPDGDVEEVIIDNDIEGEYNSFTTEPTADNPSRQDFDSWYFNNGEKSTDCEKNEGQQYSQEWEYYDTYNLPASNQKPLGNKEKLYNLRSIEIVEAEQTERKQNFHCSQCPKGFTYLRGLQQHMKYECSKKPRFKCPYCDFITKRPSTTYGHVRTRHNGMEVRYIDLFKEK